MKIHKIVSVITFSAAAAVWLAIPVAHAEDVNLACNQKAAEQIVMSSLLTDIYKRAGLNMIVHPMLGKKATIAASSGVMDGEVGRIQIYATNNPSLLKVEPAYYYVTTTGFAKSGKGVAISTKEDLKKYKIGIIRGVAHSQAATEGLSNVQLVDNSEQLYQILESGQILQ